MTTTERVPLDVHLNGDLQQVAVGIAEVDGLDRAHGAGPRDRSFLDRHAGWAQARGPGAERLAGEEAEVGGARRRPGGLGVELLPGFVQVELLRAEAEGGAPAPEVTTSMPSTSR
jgi:hypothetical protein